MEDTNYTYFPLKFTILKYIWLVSDKNRITEYRINQ